MCCDVEETGLGGRFSLRKNVWEGMRKLWGLGLVLEAASEFRIWLRPIGDDCSFLLCWLRRPTSTETSVQQAHQSWTWVFNFGLFFFLNCFWDKVFLHRLSCPGTYYVDLGDLEFMDICLSQSPECWYQRHVSPKPVQSQSLLETQALLTWLIPGKWRAEAGLVQKVRRCSD